MVGRAKPKSNRKAHAVTTSESSDARGIGDNRRGEDENPDSDLVTDPIAKEYVVKISASWRDSVVAIIETGRLLIEAKEGPNKVPHGEFSKMFQTKERKGPGVLPFTIRMGQMLMDIARHPVISNAKYISCLPASWSTLHAIAEVAYPPGVLEDLLERGVINAETTQKGYQALDYGLIAHFTRAIARLVNDFMYKWSPESLAKTLAPHAPSFWNTYDKVYLDELQALILWLTAFHAECVKVYNAAEDKRQREAGWKPGELERLRRRTR